MHFAEDLAIPNIPHKLTESAPVLSIAYAVESAVLLELDDLLYALVLKRAELGRIGFALGDRVALLQESLGTEERAELLCAERRLPR